MDVQHTRLASGRCGPVAVGVSRRQTMVRVLTALWVLGASWFPGVSGPAQGLQVQGAGADMPDNGSSLTLVLDTERPHAQRLAAARALVAAKGARAVDELGPPLRPDGDVVVQRPIVEALADAPGGTVVAFEEALLGLLAGGDESLTQWLADALGRIEQPRTVQRLIALAEDRDSRDAARRGAIRALCHQPSRQLVECLVGLLAADHPPPVRRAAFAGLRRVTGGIGVSDADAAWEAWWQEHRSKSAFQWQTMLLRRLADRAHGLADAQRRLETQLAEALRQIYQAADRDGRDALLLKWLNEGSHVSGPLAMELIGQRLIDVDAPPIGEEMRRALRDRLDDAVSDMRRRAAEALSDLGDEQAADAVAQRLETATNEHVDVLRAYLKLIRNVPRPQAIAPSVRLLADERLRSEAADALAEAVHSNGADRTWLTPEQRSHLTQQVRHHLTAAEPPNPSMIRLMGRLAEPPDWPVLGRFLESPVDAVKDAAARAWAESDQPLAHLVERGDDPVIQPHLYDAATRRGRQGHTLMRLVEQPPAAASLRSAWQQACAALAAQVRPQTVLAAERVLALAGQNLELREKMLTSAIGELLPANDDASDAKKALSVAIVDNPESRTLVDLLLARGEIWIDNGKAVPAAQLYESMTGDTGVALTASQRQRCELGRIRALLALGQVEDALAMAMPTIREGSSPGGGDPIAGHVMDLMLRAAERGIENDQLDTAGRILVEVATPDNLPAPVRRRLAALNQRLLKKQEIEEQSDASPVPVAPTSSDDSSAAGADRESGDK